MRHASFGPGLCEIFASSTCRVPLAFKHVGAMGSSRLQPLSVEAPETVAFSLTTTTTPHTLLENPHFFHFSCDILEFTVAAMALLEDGTRVRLDEPDRSNLHFLCYAFGAPQNPSSRPSDILVSR